MISMKSVTTVLELFLEFNYVEGSESLHFENVEYNDDYFRWTDKTFENKERYTVLFNDTYIRMFDTLKVKNRLYANLERVSSNTDKKRFGCKYEIVSNLVHTIPVQELTDADIADIYSNKEFARQLREEAIKDMLEKERAVEAFKNRKTYIKNGND